MTDWADRVRKEITLIDPDGNEYIARWKGNSVSITNDTGVHKFPGIPGAKIQDQAAGAKTYPLTLYFDGPDSDREANNFMIAFQFSIGQWTIFHPVKGVIFVIKLSATETVDPTDSGGLTVIETSWIETLPDSKIETIAQVQAVTEAQAIEANATAEIQFVNTARQDTPGQRQSIISTIGKVLTAIKKNLKLIENMAILDPQLLAIAAAIENLLTEPLIDTSQLAGQLQSYIQIFGLGQVDSTTAITMFSDLTNDILTIIPEQPTRDDMGGIATTEMAACAAFTAAGQMALIGGITSRSHAVTTAIKIDELFQDITQRLDEIQTLYQDKPIDLAYFSQTGSFGNNLILNSLAVRFLITSIFGLPTERRIILKEDKATMQIAKDEYGTIGSETGEIANYEKLIESNNFQGNDLWLVEAGREVLIYQ